MIMTQMHTEKIYLFYYLINLLFWYLTLLFIFLWWPVTYELLFPIEAAVKGHAYELVKRSKE